MKDDPSCIQINNMISILLFLVSLCYADELQETGLPQETGCVSFFPCGGLGIIGYPFFSGIVLNGCSGLFEVDCYDRKIRLGNNDSPWYDLLDINYHTHIDGDPDPNVFKIRHNLLQQRLQSRSCDSFKNITLPTSPLISCEILATQTTFVRCTGNTSKEYFGGYYNYTGCPGYSLYYAYYTYTSVQHGFFPAVLPPTCSVIVVPVSFRSQQNYTYSDPFEIITAEFEIRCRFSKECRECKYSGGTCSTNNNQTLQCNGGHGALYNTRKQGPEFSGTALFPGTRARTRTRLRTKLLIGTFGAAILIVIMLVLVFSYRRNIAMIWSRKTDLYNYIQDFVTDLYHYIQAFVKNFKFFARKSYRYSGVKKIVMKWRKKTKSRRTVKIFLKNYDSLAPKRYRYSDIKKMTNSFNEKLGEGGYGSVYKGKLSNGNLVAVKVLKESKGDGQEFFNEVASISRTSHVNVVTLMGFCLNGTRRALIYEFMPNGSLEKFVYDGNTNRRLAWDKYYKIAIGIARGLEYLHRGCNTRILHFDIKPHNILLDEEFVPKISDFGLAKLCPGKESAVSMMNARGTIGYIAPEVFCRDFGRVSYKSDVYSYGMMVLEMVGWRKNAKVEVGNTSEIYFPDWIYKELESNKEMEMYGIMNEDENAYKRRMIIASLWCIQSDPSNRPSMSRVVEMLEGSLESLEIPPKPVFPSPQLSTALKTSNW